MTLRIKSLEFKNFLSYGDYISKLDFENLGIALIIGWSTDGQSNGIGKSTISSALLWCLFGKLHHKANPGDKVVNWHVNKDCYVKLTTMDGWVIVRTRKMDNHDDLIIYNSNDEDETRSTNTAAQDFLNKKFKLDYHLFVSSMFFGQIGKSFLEMSDVVRKPALERLLGLNKLNIWAAIAKKRYKEGEAAIPPCRDMLKWQEDMVEEEKRSLIEAHDNHKIFEDSRVKFILIRETEIKNTQDKLKNWDARVVELQSYRDTYLKLEKLESYLERVREDKFKVRSDLATCSGKIDATKSELERVQNRIIELEKYNLKILQVQHNETTIAENKLSEIDSKYAEIKVNLNVKKEEAKNLALSLQNWRERSDSVCPSCQQSIGKDHVDVLCIPYKEHAVTLTTEIAVLNEQIKTLDASRPAINKPTISLADVLSMESELCRLKNYDSSSGDLGDKFIDLQSKLDALITTEERTSIVIERNKPSITITDIELEQKEYDIIIKDNLRLKNEIDIERNKQNPYDNILSSSKNKLNKGKEEIKRLNSKLDEMNMQLNHEKYLYKSYSDRRKIKRMLLDKLIPYLNSRIKYYLDCFECDIDIKFNNNLGVDSKWGYDFCSGGERKRIDLSIMFALYDLHLGLNGSQCNIMVLDEVDGRLDANGIEALIKILSDNFTSSNNTTRVTPDAILVVSHRNEMVDAFPTKISIKRDHNRFSHIVEVA